MNSEALLWLGVILATPATFMLSKVAFALLLGLFIKDDKVTITYTDKRGVTKKTVVRLQKGDELLHLMDEVKSQSSKYHRGRRA